MSRVKSCVTGDLWLDDYGHSSYQKVSYRMYFDLIEKIWLVLCDVHLLSAMLDYILNFYHLDNNGYLVLLDIY